MDLEVVFPFGTHVRGQVTDVEGRPLGGIHVVLELTIPGFGEFGRGSLYVTDSRGVFEFPGVIPETGEYSLLAWQNRGFRPVRKRIDGFNMIHNLRLETGFTVEGVVVDVTTGGPVTGIQVMTLDTEAGVVLESEAETDADGRFRFSNMRDVEYRLMVRGAEIVDPPVTVVGGQEKQITVRVTPRRE